MSNSTSTNRRRKRLGSSRPHTRLQGKPSVGAKPGESGFLQVNGLKKAYRKGGHEIPVLKGTSFSVMEAEFVSIVGQSGSGKSTLLHVLGTLDRPDQGEIWYDGKRIDQLPASGRDRLRNSQIGMVFQFYHLLPELSTLENVLVPRMIKHSLFKYLATRKADSRRARQLLELVGLSHRLTHKPSELSGGEMQRAAIARALIARPRVLLADEPTGNLDRANGDEILKILRRLNREEQVTILMVTHDNALAEQADRVIRLVDGRVSVG